MTDLPPLTGQLLREQLAGAGCLDPDAELARLVEAARTTHQLRALVAARAEGVPLEHLTGWAEFDGRRVGLRPRVFVPRERTEALLARTRALLSGGELVLDLCCGSGALALALLHRHPDLEVHASDLDLDAVGCARENLTGRADVHRGDLFDALPAGLRGRFDVVVANVPYVPSGAIAFLPREHREHLPRLGLDGGPDGLDVLRRVAAAAGDWLAPGGHLLSEVAADQVAPALALLARPGWTVQAHHDPELEAHVVQARVDRVGAGPWPDTE